ncbi:MAG: hypothetical protein K5848_05510, partial [Lachnospiraceae bacterium]|nr:hypothetical protein [Lachnospiraceae bacterium]
MPGKKAGKHEVAVENCQWISLSGDNALDENNDFTFEIPVGVKKAKVSYLITAWTDDNKLATYADPDGGSKDLSKKEVQDYDESGNPVGDPYLVDADESYVVKVNGEDELTADSNKYGENAYDESGKGTYTANLHFSKDFWNDWCAIVVVVEETVSGVAPEPTPTPEDVVHEIHGGTVFLAGANEDWSGIQSEGYAYHFGETVRVSLDNASINNPYYLVPAIVFDNEIDDANMLEEMFDVDVKVYADGEEVQVTIPENQPTIWAEDTAFNGVNQTGNCARLYGGINAWGTSYIDPTALNGAETVVYEITINKIDGKAYILGGDENWATVQSEPVEFTVGKPFEITMNGPISNPYWVAPSLIFNQNFVDPNVLDALYRVNVELTVDGNPVDIAEPSARIWAEANEIVVPGEVDEEGNPVKIKYDGNSARLYGGYNEWGTAYVPKDTFNNANVITYSITIERVEGVAYLLGGDSNWSPVQSDPVEFKIDGSEYEVSVEGSINNPYWIAPTLIFYNEFDDPETLNERLDVTVSLVVDGTSKAFGFPENYKCIWAEDSEIIVPGEVDEEGNPVKIKYSGNAARLYGGYNEWGDKFIPQDTFNTAESIRYIFKLSWDVTSGIKVPEGTPDEPEEDDDIEWVGTSTFLQGEGNGYQDVTATSSNGITLTMEQWRIAVTFSEEALDAISEMEAPVLSVEREGNAEIWGFGIEDANWTYLAGGNDSSGTTATLLTTAFDSSISYYIDVRDWETTNLKVSVTDSPDA